MLGMIWHMFRMNWSIGKRRIVQRIVVVVVVGGEIIGMVEQQQQQQQQQQRQQQQQQQGAASANGGTTTRYQVPTNALHAYRTLVGGDNADDSTVASGDYLESSGDSGEDPYGSSGNGRQLRRKSRQNSISTCMSALTLDSCELVDILENLEI